MSGVWWKNLHEVRSVFVDDGTERESIPERARQVLDVHVGVPGACDAAPLL